MGQLEPAVPLRPRPLAKLLLQSVGDEGQDADRMARGFSESGVGLVVEAEGIEERGRRGVEAPHGILAEPSFVDRLLFEDQPNAVLGELAPPLRQSNALRTIAPLRLDALDVAVLLSEPDDLAARLSTDRELRRQLGQGPGLAPDEGNQRAKAGTDPRVITLAFEALDRLPAQVGANHKNVADPIALVTLDGLGERRARAQNEESRRCCAHYDYYGYDCGDHYDYVYDYDD